MNDSHGYRDVAPGPAEPLVLGWLRGGGGCAPVLATLGCTAFVLAIVVGFWRSAFAHVTEGASGGRGVVIAVLVTLAGLAVLGAVGFVMIGSGGLRIEPDRVIAARWHGILFVPLWRVRYRLLAPVVTVRTTADQTFVAVIESGDDEILLKECEHRAHADAQSRQVREYLS